MPRFEVKQTRKLNLTSYSGLALIGQYCQTAQVEAVVDPCLPVSQGTRISDVVKSMVGPLILGKNDFEAIEPFHEDRVDKEALVLAKGPGSVWLRQRLDARGAELRELTSLRLLERTEAPTRTSRARSAATSWHLASFGPKTDPERKRLHSGKFANHDAIVHLASFADHCLRPLGQTHRRGRWCRSPPGQAPATEDDATRDRYTARRCSC